MFLCNVHKCSFINPRSSLLMFEWYYKVCAIFLSSDTSHSLLIWHSTISSGFKWISFCWVFPQRCYYRFALSPFAFCTRLCTTFWWYNFSNLNKILFPKQETKAFWKDTRFTDLLFASKITKFDIESSLKVTSATKLFFAKK